MKNTFYILAVLLGVVVLVPVLAAAHVDPADPTHTHATSTTNVRPNATTTPRNTPAVKLEARLERAKEKAGQEIERRTAALNRLETRIAAMKRVSDSFKSDLSTTIDAEIAKLTALRTKIEASTNGEEIKTDVQSITRSYRVFALVMPKAAIATAADKIVTITTTLSEIGAKLKVRVDAAAAAGTDVASLNTALTDLANKISSANTHAQAAVSGTAALMPDDGDKAKMETNKKALEAARAELKAAHDDVKAARGLVKQIMDTLKPANASSTLQTGVNADV